MKRDQYHEGGGYSMGFISVAEVVIVTYTCDLQSLK